MTGRTVHVIPHVSMSRTKSVHAVLPPKVVWLFFSPVAKFIRAPIHPGEQSLCSNVIQTDPGLVTVVPVLNIDILFLTFNCGKISSHASADCTGV